MRLVGDWVVVSQTGMCYSVMSCIYNSHTRQGQLPHLYFVSSTLCMKSFYKYVCLWSCRKTYYKSTSIISFSIKIIFIIQAHNHISDFANKWKSLQILFHLISYFVEATSRLKYKLYHLNLSPTFKLFYSSVDKVAWNVQWKLNLLLYDKPKEQKKKDYFCFCNLTLHVWKSRNILFRYLSLTTMFFTLFIIKL